MKKLLILFCVFFSCISIVKAEENFAPSAKSAILIDTSSGKVLFENNADEKLPPASMTKIMSMLLIMESIDNGTLNFDDEITISKNAADMGGSQIFLQEGEIYKVSELLKGIAIASGNDAVVSLSEKIGGSVQGFVDLMNKRASELGLQNTHFMNPHGLDTENHYSSARDMSIMARELLKHDKILNFTSIYEEYLTKNDGSKTWLVNTNKLVRFYKGADGLKTGFTQNAGYCLTATAKKNDLRLISVVMGEPTIDARSAETIALLNYGFNTYKTTLIKAKKESIGRIKVENGQKDYVDVSLIDDATELQKINDPKHDYQFNIMIDKIKAPINIGDKIGEVEIIDQDKNKIGTFGITVQEDIKKATFWDYLKRNIKLITNGKLVIKN
jgi:serine-type D-Ala-D-Ala carboxypeptidase (penicillin-binding protein 5/6)